MILTARVDKDGFIENYLNLWNGGFKLTASELNLLRLILDKALSLIADGVKEPYLSQLTLSRESIGKIKKELNLSDSGLHAIKKKLIDKHILIEVEDGLVIRDCVIPQKEITFKFIVDGE